MKQSKILVLAIASALTAGVAFAATPPASTTAKTRIDANGDGVITRAEAAARPKFAERFDQLDVNKDGRLDAGERPQHGMHGGRGGDRMAKLDANGDGAIDRSEAAKIPRLANRFDQLDANKNGRIDANERPQRGMHGDRHGGGMMKLDANGDGAIDRSEAAKVPRLADKFDQLDANRNGRIDASERPQRGMHGEHGGGMAKLDADHDGRLSRSEAANSPMAQRFDQLDANRDGYVTRDEARAAFKQMRESRGMAPKPAG